LREALRMCLEDKRSSFTCCKRKDMCFEQYWSWEGTVSDIQTRNRKWL